MEDSIIALLFLVVGSAIALLIVLRLFLGQRTFSYFLGHLLVELVKLVVVAPFKIIGYLLKLGIELAIRYGSNVWQVGGSLVSLLRRLV
jgi:hypothetical protein